MRGEALGGLTCAACAWMAYAVRGRSSTFLAPSVYRGSRRRRSIALTFDDGPSEGTNQLLQILNRYQAPATFFVCGMNVKRLPAVARTVAAFGHEIGNHSYSHPALYLRSRRFIKDELLSAQSIIADTTGTAPTLFRAPYGARWFGLRQAQRELNLLGASTYRGTTFIDQGIVTIGTSAALGTAGSAPIQTVKLTGATAGSTTFQLTFNGATTAPIIYTGNAATDAANI